MQLLILPSIWCVICLVRCTIDVDVTECEWGSIVLMLFYFNFFPFRVRSVCLSRACIFTQLCWSIAILFVHNFLLHCFIFLLFHLVAYIGYFLLQKQKENESFDSVFSSTFFGARKSRKENIQKYSEKDIFEGRQKNYEKHMKKGHPENGRYNFQHSYHSCVF